MTRIAVTRIDLDEIERKARAALKTWWLTGRNTPMVIDQDGTTRSAGLHLGPSNVDHISANSPLATLALIARIRELESALHKAIDGWTHDPDIAPLLEILQKGAVLP